jgi:uncharacterized protein YceK
MLNFFRLLLIALLLSLSGCASTSSDDMTMQGYGGPHNYADSQRY